jgi:signal transduction histidine kinase
VAALLVLTTADLGQHYRIPLGAALAFGIARGFGLALAWLRPRASTPVSLLVATLIAAVSVPISSSEAWPWPVTSVFGVAVVLAIVGARGASRREQAGWWMVTQVVGVVALLIAPERGSWPGLLTMAIFCAVAVVVGDLLRSQAETRRQLAAQEDISAEERAERARWQERARIARELHDVVAHHLSVVVVRADSAPHRLTGLPDDAREEFAGIAEDARSSLTEMRRVLRLLREDPAIPDQLNQSQLGPQPGLVQLEDLVVSTRRAGADVRLEADVPAGLDPAVELNAYRVVQEAISNAVRHAPKAVVQVAVRVIGSELRLTVVNGPARADVPVAPGSGHGVIGMRERVALVDGVFHAGPTADGGYLVEVAIPMSEEGDR